MPITLPNFSANQPQKGLVSDLSTALSAYMAQKQEDLKNEGQQYENMYTKAKGEKAPEFVESEIQRNKNLALMEALKIAHESKYGPLQAQADLEAQQALTRHRNAEAQYAGKTTTQKDLAAAFGEGTPEYNNALKKSYNVLEQGGNEIGVPYEQLQAHERTHATKSMESDLKRADSQVASYKKLKSLKDIQLKHPDMSTDFSVAIMNPDKKAGILEAMKRKYLVNKGKLAAIEKFEKLTADLVATGGEAMGGGQRFTDKLQELYKARKPDARNTPEANLFVIDNLMNEMLPGFSYGKDLRHGLKNRIKIIPDDEKYRELSLQEMERPNKTSSVDIQGQKYGVTPEIADKASALRREQEPSEEDITYTMGKYGLSREEVLNRIRQQSGR